MSNDHRYRTSTSSMTAARIIADGGVSYQIVFKKATTPIHMLCSACNQRGYKLM